MEDAHKRRIEQALYDLRMAFGRANLPCPDVVGYSDVKKAAEAEPSFRYVTLAGAPYDRGSISLVGIQIRFDLADNVKLMPDDEIGMRVRQALGI